MCFIMFSYAGWLAGLTGDVFLFLCKYILMVINLLSSVIYFCLCNLVKTLTNIYLMTSHTESNEKKKNYKTIYKLEGPVTP